MPVTVSPFPVHICLYLFLLFLFIIWLFLRVSSWSSRWTTRSRDVTSSANPVLLGTSRERWDFNFFIFWVENYFFLFSARPLAHQLLWSVGVWPEVVGFVWQGGGDGNWGGIVIRFFYSDFRPLCFRSIQLCFLAASRQTLKYTFRFSQTLKKTYFWRASRKPSPSFWRDRWPRRGKAMLGCIQPGWLCCNCKRLPIKSQTLKKILNQGNVFNGV